MSLDYDIEIGDDFLFKEIENKEEYNRIVELISQMDEKYSLTLYYYYFLEHSVKNISELMGISEKTVYTRLNRGKMILKELLGPFGV